MKLKMWVILSITVLLCYLNSNYQFGDNHKSREVKSAIYPYSHFLNNNNIIKMKILKMMDIIVK